MALYGPASTAYGQVVAPDPGEAYVNQTNTSILGAISPEEQKRIENNSNGEQGFVDTEDNTPTNNPNDAAQQAMARGDPPPQTAMQAAGNFGGSDPDRAVTGDGDVYSPVEAVPNNDDSNYSNEGKNKQSASPTAGPHIITVPNPLHQFSSYTYGLALHMLTKADFNSMVENPGSDWKPTTTVIASAGKYGGPGSGFERNKFFTDDFYFDNLKMTTVIGSTAGNRGTNAINVSFTLIEPYGVTLIDRLIDACNDKEQVDGKSYTLIPYLLQIDFYGYDDEGIPHNLVSQRKFIPIKITDMKIKVGVKGAEYSIGCCIYAHSGFQESISATPANFEITASSLEDYFKPDENVEAALKVFNERTETDKKAQEKQAAQQDGNVREQEIDKSKQETGKKPVEAAGTSSGPASGDAGYTVRSYVAAYNAWSEQLKKNSNQTDYNIISITFDPDILKDDGGNMVDPKSQPMRQTAEKNVKNSKQAGKLAQADAGKNTAQPDNTVSKYSVRAGDTVTDIINRAMIKSDYIRKQMIDPTIGIEENVAKKKEGESVRWWKIIPTVKLRMFCQKTSKWYLDVNYYVKSYTVYNRTHPAAQKSLPTGWHKEYNYIYTGKNTDIIDFNIELDNTYYTAVAVDRGKYQAVSEQGGVNQADLTEQDPNVDTSGDSNYSNEGRSQAKVQTNSVQNVGDQADATATGGLKNDSKTQAATSMAENVNRGYSDQITVSLTIVGDPQFIKQDEVYESPNARSPDATEATNIGSDEGSIAMDDSEIHMRLNWRTPVDIDEETGGLRLDGRYTTSNFSGLYRIIEVESTFAGGKFTQTISCNRLFDQPEDNTTTQNTSDIRKDNTPVLQKDSEVNENAPKAVDSAPTAKETNSSILSAITGKSYTDDTSVTDTDSNTGDIDNSEEIDEVDSDAAGRDPDAADYADIVEFGPTENISQTTSTRAEQTSTVTEEVTGGGTTTEQSLYNAKGEVVGITTTKNTPASSLVTDTITTNTGSISTSQITAHPAYQSTYQSSVASGQPPLVAAKNASTAAKQAIVLGNGQG